MINFDMMFRNLLIGSCPRTPIDVERLHSHLKVGAVLNLQTEDDFVKWGVDWPAVEEAYARSGIVCARVPILDWDADDLRVHLVTAVDTLDELIEEDHRVYVHCTAGIGRAPATVIGYLAWSQAYGLDTAIEYVRQRRKIDPYIDVLREVEAMQQSA